MADRHAVKTALIPGLLFFAIFLGLYSIYHWSEPYLHHYFVWLASSVCAVVELFDKAVACRDNVIYYNDIASLRVIEGCDGVTVFILIIAAVFAFPKPWKERLSGVLVLVPVLFFLNWLRLFVLTVIRFYLPDYFGVVHVYLFQPVMVFATFLCFIAWIMHNETPDRAG